MPGMVAQTWWATSYANAGKNDWPAVARRSKLPSTHTSQAGAAVQPLDLMETARGLAELSPRRASQANLRRAVSTAYYAMFHCLAACAANALIGRTRDAAWHQTYRALEHGKARRACENKAALTAFPLEVRRFADVFRHFAEGAAAGRLRA